MDTWKQYSGMWPLQTQMQAAAASNWPGASLALYSWGNNTDGGLGQNNTISQSYPTQIGNLNTWKQVSGSNFYAVGAVKADGTLWTWGYNSKGELGQNDRVTRSSPVQVGALTNWYQISFGTSHICAVKTDGTLWAWGGNEVGQLCQNDLVYRSSPVQVGALTNWNNVSAGYRVSFILQNDGKLWVCGKNSSGQLGQNDRVDRSSPVQIGALTNWKNIYNDVSEAVVAIKTDNTAWSWAGNPYGELGQNDRVYRSSPTQIGALTNWQSSSSNGDLWFLAIKTNNTLWGWGFNLNGELGQNDLVDRSSPVQIGALTTWAVCNAGSNSGYAIKTDGTLWSWGTNTAGALGQNNLIARSSPVQMGSATTWKDVAGNGNMAIAIYKA